MTLEDNPGNSSLSEVVAANPGALFGFVTLVCANCGLLFPQMELFLEVEILEFDGVLPQISALPVVELVVVKNELLRSGFVDETCVPK